MVLEGSNATLINAGLNLEKGPSHLIPAPLYRYKSLYGETNVDHTAPGIFRLEVWFGGAVKQEQN